MSTPELPTTRPLAAPFNDGLRDGVLRYQHCTACGTAQTLARYACQHCGASDQLLWLDAAGAATVSAVTVIARAPSDEFRALAPYTLVVVRLDEGPRFMAHATPGVRIGDAVQAVFFEHRGRRLVRFALAA